MVYCSECGRELKKESGFCSNCGKKLDKTVDYELARNIKKFAKKSSENFERNAEQFGKRMEKYGKRIERRFDKSAKRFEHWHDRYFGILGPLIGSFLGLIILRIIIEVMALNSTDFPIMAKTSELLYPYQLIFFGLMLLTSYSNYISRKYRTFKLFLPIPSTISFTAGLWILSTIYNDLYDAFENIPNFTIISNFIVNNIALIFVIILLIGLIFNTYIYYNEIGKIEEKKDT